MIKTINLYVACFSVLTQATIKKNRRPLHSQLSRGFYIAGSRDGVLLRAMRYCVLISFEGRS